MPRRVCATQPALSRQIRDLEAELSLRLFDRSNRRVRLTPAGDDVLRRSRDALVEIDALREHARSLGGGRVGILRVGASPQVLETVLSDYAIPAHASGGRGATRQRRFQNGWGTAALLTLVGAGAPSLDHVASLLAEAHDVIPRNSVFFGAKLRQHLGELIRLLDESVMGL